MLIKFINSVCHRCINVLEHRAAKARRARSLRDLAKLDDRLLDDVGLYRDHEGNILSALETKKSVAQQHDLKKALHQSPRRYFCRGRIAAELAQTQAALTQSVLYQDALNQTAPNVGAISALFGRAQQKVLLYLRRSP